LIHTLRGRGYVLSETVPAHQDLVEHEEETETT
jgi:hypothetical protein